MRKPTAFGFYPFDEKELDKVVSRLLVADDVYENARGVIVPHAGYQFSGAIAGKTFASAKTDAKRFILLGPNHSGVGAFAAKSEQDWLTPLGMVVNDTGMLKDIIVDEQVHEQEHSLEVQLPFLQKVYGDYIKIIPIVFRDMDFNRIKGIAKHILENNDSVFYVCSSDFIHFGPNYDYMPVTENVVEWVKEQDSKLLGYIENLDARGFYDMVKEQGLTVCGSVAITLMLLVMKKLGVQAKTVAYNTSLAVHASDSFVSYAGVVFY
jgi:hypothetical protein